MPGPGKLDGPGFRNLKVWQGAGVAVGSDASYVNKGSRQSSVNMYKQTVCGALY